MSELKFNIYLSLLEAQRRMGDAVKGSTNPYFKSSYADLNAIREVAIPALNSVGITVLQPTKHINGKNFVVTMLLNTSGECVQAETEIVQAKPGDPQSFGAGITYARRFGLQSLLNIGAVDDDCESQYDRPQNTQPQKPANKIYYVTFGKKYKGLSFGAIGKTNLSAYRTEIATYYKENAEPMPLEIDQFLKDSERWINEQ